MICVRLEGGLGNQMFQYAAGRALATRHNTDLILDPTALHRIKSQYTRRDLELYHFGIRSQIAKTGEFKKIHLLHRFPALSNWLSPWHLAVEHSLLFNDTFTVFPDNTYLYGYWQSFRYFSSVASEIFHDFQPIEELSQDSRDTALHIDSSESVSIHVRRGDYVTLKSASSMHGALDGSYYTKAISKILTSLSKPFFFVFSDDPDWCMSNLTLPTESTRYICHNSGSADWQDLMLMSRCKHNIIANSSFSWWGAWLGDQRYGSHNRFVYAPNNWFVRNRYDMKDRFPSHWIGIQ